jgi:hypothetical protein
VLIIRLMTCSVSFPVWHGARVESRTQAQIAYVSFMSHLFAEMSEPVPGLLMLLVIVPCPKLCDPGASAVKLWLRTGYDVPLGIITVGRFEQTPSGTS